MNLGDQQFSDVLSICSFKNGSFQWIIWEINFLFPPGATIDTLFVGSNISLTYTVQCCSTTTCHHEDYNASHTNSCAIVNGKQET